MSLIIPNLFANRSTDIQLSDLDDNFNYILSIFDGSLNIGGSLALGNFDAISTNTPVTLDLGGTYSATAGSNAKLKLFSNGTDYYGLGVSLYQLDYICPALGSHVFYQNNVKLLSIARGDGTGVRITGDLSNATESNRVLFQTSTTNGNSTIGVIPNGTATSSAVSLYGSATTANSTYGLLQQNGTATMLVASKDGTGSYGDLELWAGGVRHAWFGPTTNFSTVSSINVGEGTGAGANANIEIGGNRSADGITFIDFHSSVGTDFDFRLLRDSGVNGGAEIRNIGGGQISVIANTNGARLTSGATSWSAISDETQKDIIEPITNGVDKVSQLRSVIGKYKTEENIRRPFLIAQDVQTVLPEAVVEIEEDGKQILALAYTDVIPLLVAAINELSARVKELESK